MNAAELVELRKQGSISQEEFFVGLNRLRRANNGSSAAVAEASAADLIPSGSGGGPAPATAHKEQRCGSSPSAGSAGDTAKRRSDEDAEDCVEGVGVGGVGSINGPGAASSAEIVGRRPAVESDAEPSNEILFVEAPKGVTGGRRVDEVPGRSYPRVRDEGCDSPDVRRTEPHRGEVVAAPCLSSPESKQQEPVLEARVDGEGQMQRRVDDVDGVKEAEPPDADDDPEWLISPSGERTQQATSNRRRSAGSTRGMLERRDRARTREGGDHCYDDGGSSRSIGPVGAGTSSHVGGNHCQSAGVLFERRHPAESPSWRPASAQLVQPDRRQESCSNSSSDSMWLSLPQPTATPHSVRRGVANSGYSKTGYPLGPSPKRPEGGHDYGITEGPRGPVPRPHWRPAGGGNFQPHRRSSVASSGSSNSGSRRLSRSLPVTPLRSHRFGGGDAREGDGRRSSDGLRSDVEEPSSRKGADDRAAPLGGGGHHSGVYNGDCGSSAGYPDPCRSPPQRRRPQFWQEARADGNSEERASSPEGPAAAGGVTGNRAPATPYADRRRRRCVDDDPEQNRERVAKAEAAYDGVRSPKAVRPREAAIREYRALHGCGEGGGGGGSGGGGGDTGINTVPPLGSAGGLWRNRSRRREPQGEPPPSREFRARHRGNTVDGVGRFGSGRSRKTTTSCDRYGYPLHEPECLGSTGAGGGGGGGGSSNGHKFRFSPMIKGLPDFYASRPKRQSHETPFERSLGSPREVGIGRSSTAVTSLYERTTEWQTRASKLRARKLAHREEQELNACTFQPNVQPRWTPGTGGASTVVGSAGTSGRRADHSEAVEGRSRSGDSGGVRDGGDRGGDGSVDGDGGGVENDIGRGDGGCVGGGDGEREGNRGEGTGDGAGGTVEDKRLSGLSKGSAASPRKKFSGNVAQRLFNEAGRMEERRFEGQERKRMWEEETYARTCTFQPSLVQGKFGSTIYVPSRYRNPPRAASAPPGGRRPDYGQEALTFHPKILGVKPGMTHALEYLSLGVTERLYHGSPYCNDDQRQSQQAEEARNSSECPSGGQQQQQQPDGGSDYEYADDGRREQRGYPDGLRSPRSERLGRGRRFYPSCSNCSRNRAGPEGSDRGEGDSWDGARRSRGTRGSSFGRQRDDRRPTSPATSAATTTTAHHGRLEYEPRERCAEGNWSNRPRSAPAAAFSREHLRRTIRHSGARWAGARAGTGDARGRADRLGEGAWAERVGRGGDRGGGGCGSQGHRRRQNSISFGEFLARQAHSQATAKHHLSRLTAQQSPSFTPQLSRGTRRMVARNGGLAASAGGGRFEDRLNVAARRRLRDRKAALVAARTLEGKACTFVPELTPRAKTARSRSARELSLGDAVLREAKLRMARAREEIRLLDNHDNNNSSDAAGDRGRSFEPTLETAGDDGLAPTASSRLRLADELDTYVDRVQEAARQREEHVFREKRRQQAEEQAACTFQPQMKASRCPDLVKRTAAGMRCIREFRRQQEEQRLQEEAFLLASSSGSRGRLMPGPAAADRPRWRYT